MPAKTETCARGHKSVECMMIYITIEKAVFKGAEGQWISEVAHNIEEAQMMVDVGFEYVVTRH